MLSLHLVFLLISTITLPLLSSGLNCKCIGESDCSEEGTCNTTAGGVCFVQYYHDLSGKHWNLRRGCLSDPSSVICQYTKSDSHVNMCCNDTNLCNDDSMITTEPPVVSCHCNGNSKCDNGLCTLRSPKHSCYTILRKVGSIMSYERGCVRKCKEYHRDDDRLRWCCRGDRCNNEIPSEWPSPSSTVVTATPDILTSEQPTTLDPRRPRELICHCSGCRNGGTTCLAAVACASHVIDTVKMTWCVQDEFSCKNDSFQLNCCYNDYCNGPSRPIPGPPCDDEDNEASGGCDFGPVTSSTALPSPTTATATTTSTESSEATPTSSSKATPTENITEDSSEAKYDNSEMMMIFYFFTVLLLLCIIMMIVVIVACVAMVCHYRGMAYKTVLSSSTILESAMKEKGFPVANSSPV